MHKEADIRLPLILGDKSYKDITEDIVKPIEGKAPKTWYLTFYDFCSYCSLGGWVYSILIRNRSWCLGS